jgi:uncharacterized protein with PQ loop repeat
MNFLKQINGKAIIIGILLELCSYAVVFVGTMLTLAFYASRLSPSTGDHTTEIYVATAAGIIVSAVLYLFVGFMVGHVSRAHEILNASLVAAIFVAYPLIKYNSALHSLDFVTVIEIPICHILGGYLAQRQRLAVGVNGET